MYNYGPDPSGQPGGGSPYGPPAPQGGYQGVPQPQPSYQDIPQQPQGYDPNQGYESPGIPSAPPVSGPPVTVPPVQTGPVLTPTAVPPSGVGGPERPKGSPTVPILAASTALLFVTTAVFLFLFINTNGDLTDAEHTISNHENTIASQTEQIGGLQSDLDEAEATIDTLTTELAVVGEDAEKAEQLKACLTATYDFIDAVGANASEERLNELIDEANKQCDPVWSLIG